MGIRKVFKTTFSEVRVFVDEAEKTELQSFFEYFPDKIFINDFVFIEENKSKFDRKKLLAEIPEEAFLVLPFFNKE